MDGKYLLEEKLQHGTKSQPVEILRFDTGPGTGNPEPYFVPRHWHSYVEILIFQKGSFTVELNLEDIVFREGEICFINSGELHQIHSNESESCHEVVLFDPQILKFAYTDEMQEVLLEPFVNQRDVLPNKIPLEHTMYTELYEELNELIRICRLKEGRWYFYAKLKILYLLSRIQENGGLISSKSVLTAVEREKIDRYKNIISYMEENYMKTISREELADVIHCNPQYLCHFFKKISGVSPVNYLIQLRIEQAKRMLKESNLTILEISMECGFNNTSYFVRQFRKYTGKTPREYRRNLTSALYHPI